MSAITEQRKSPADEISKLYQIPERDKVFSFIFQNILLSDLLLEAPSKIKQYFPASSLLLQVDTDPELGWETLIIRIVTDLSAEETSDLLDQLSQDWWLKKKYLNPQSPLPILLMPLFKQ